jgi:outer membrane protein OmpA-like peptidoglycan-associated protein
MSRANLLYSEIQSLSGDWAGRNETADYENDFDGHLDGLVKDLNQALESLKYQGTAFLKQQKNLTGIRPTDFNSFGKVSTLRSTGSTIVLEKMIPLIIQSKGFRKASEVVKFFNSFEDGSIVQTFARILLYTPHVSLDTDNKKEIEKRREIVRLIEKKSAIEISEKPIPVVQTGAESKDSRNENRIAGSAPDTPGINITGRFEFIDTNKTHPSLGMTLSVNQAGNWLEGVISMVADGTYVTDRNIPKQYFRFYAAVKDWNKSINLLYVSGNADFYSDSVSVKITNKDQLDVWYKTKDKKDALLEFWRVSSNPILTERHFKTLNNALVKQSQWFPLLSNQLDNILSYLRSFTGYTAIHHYTAPDDSAAITSLKIENRKANVQKLLLERDKGNVTSGKKLFSSFSQFVLENFHPSDHLLASFYCRYYLQQNILTSEDKWKLSYLYAITRYFHIDGYRDFSATRFLSSGNEKMFSKEKHEYVIEAKMRGFGGFIGIGGGGYYRGDFTIKCKQWEKMGVKDPVVLRISLWELGIGLGGGVSLGKSFKAVAVTNYLWKPDDFIGSYVIKKVEVGISGYELAGIGGLLGVMDLDSKKIGKSLTFQVYDLDANILGIEMEPHKEFEAPKSKAKPKIGAEASESIGAGSIWKGGKLPVAPDVLKLAEEATKFGALYAAGEKNHFKHNSAFLTPGASNAVRRMCANEMALLINKGTKVEIIGHADRSGDEVYNEKLSLNRAKNVEQKIRDVCGSSLGADIKAKGVGEKESKNADHKRNPLDRKVEIKINGVIVLQLIA